MSSFTNIFSGSLLTPSFSFYEAITLSSNLQLSWNTDFGPNPNVVAAIMQISPTANGYSLIMPNALNISVGFSFSINNKTRFSFKLVANDGATIIDTITGPSFSTFYLTSNSSVNGTWELVPYGVGTGSVTSVAISAGATSGNIVIGGSPITLAGTITLALGADLGALTGLGASTGIAVRTAANGTWTTTSMMVGMPNQVAIVNGNGVAGPPTFSLVPTLANLSSISLNSGGNIDIGVTPNVITANNSGGGLTLSANAIGGNVFITSPAGSILLSASSAGTTAAAFSLITSGASLSFSGIAANVFMNAASTTSSYSIKLPTGPGSVNQVLQITSVASSTLQTSWISAGSGTVTAITAGTNLTGGTITTTGTIALASALTGLTSVSTNTLISSPAASGAAGLVLGVPYQNSLGYDVTLQVYFDITSNTSGVISCGVGPTNTPPQQVIVTGSTTVGYLPVSVYLPNNYYALISTTGTITIAIRGQNVTPV